MVRLHYKPHTYQLHSSKSSHAKCIHPDQVSQGHICILLVVFRFNLTRRKNVRGWQYRRNKISSYFHSRELTAQAKGKKNGGRGLHRGKCLIVSVRLPVPNIQINKELAMLQSRSEIVTPHRLAKSWSITNRKLKHSQSNNASRFTQQSQQWSCAIKMNKQVYWYVNLVNVMAPELHLSGLVNATYMISATKQIHNPTSWCFCAWCVVDPTKNKTENSQNGESVHAHIHTCIYIYLFLYIYNTLS